MNHQRKLILCGVGGLACALFLAKWLLAGALLAFGAVALLVVAAELVLLTCVVGAIVLVPPLFAYVTVTKWLKRPGELGFLGDVFVIVWMFSLVWLLSIVSPRESASASAPTGHGPHESNSEQVRRELFTNPADYSAQAAKWMSREAVTGDIGVDPRHLLHEGSADRPRREVFTESRAARAAEWLSREAGTRDTGVDPGFAKTGGDAASSTLPKLLAPARVRAELPPAEIPPLKAIP
jgi:hypothetical protein